jgi:NADH-quinone oxidoreductase subunit N
MNAFNIVLALLPENILLAGIVVLIALEVCDAGERNALPTSLAVLVLASAASAWLSGYGYAFDAFPGQYSVDAPALLAKAIVIALAFAVVLMSRDEVDQPQFHLLLLASLYGVCLLLSADSFVTLFLGLELMSLPVYAMVVLAFRRTESAEAALKYLVLGGTATAMLLMGVSLLYGGSGSLAVSVFTDAAGSPQTMPRVAVVLILIAFFVKAAIVPFHAWAPDAYETAAVPVTAYMAAIVKAGVVLGALRLFGTARLTGPIVDLVAVLALLSIVWGNLAAMRQQSFRRMIAYSSIAHAGYLFYAFLGEGPGRFQAIVFYVIAYGAMNLLAFASLPRDEDDFNRDRLDNLKGLFHRRPYAAVMIAVAMLSLAGLPPFPGFVAKFLIFKNVISAGFTLYGVLGLIGSYLGIYFYLRVIQYLFMTPEDSQAAVRSTGRLAHGASIICALVGLLLAVFPGWVIGQF